MSDFPDLSAFTAVLADRRFVAAAIVSALSGLVRGFSGFGSALIYIPLISAIYEPRIAAVTLAADRLDQQHAVLAARVLALQLARGRADRGRGRPHDAGRNAGADLRRPDHAALDHLCGLVLMLLACLRRAGAITAGRRLPAWRRSERSAGLGSGAVQIAGPPVIMFWLGGRSDARTVRANLMVFFVLMGAAACVSYFVQGIVHAPTCWC